MLLQLAEGKFSHKDGPDGRFHTVICGGCQKSGHLKKAGKVDMGGGKTSHAFQCKNCGETTRVVNQADEEIKPGGSEVNNPKKLTEAKDSLEKASTPKPFSTSKTSNWVARGGGLPPYIQHVAHALVDKRGKTESEAIRMAIGIVKNWAAGKGKVDANTKAAAAKAVAQWMKLRAKAAGKRAAKTAKSIAEAELIESLLALEEGETEKLEESFLLELAEDAPMGFDVGDPVRRYAPDDTGCWGLGEQGEVIAENVDPEDGAYIYDVRWHAGIQRNVRQFDLRNVRDMSLAEARGTKTKTPLPKPAKPEDPAKAKDASQMETAGDRVGHLQRRLTSLGFELNDDGQFGPVTQSAVKDFQRNAILVPDGIVGPKTTEALAGAPTPEDMASADTDSDGVPDDAETTTDATGREGTAVNRSSGATAETLYKGLGVGVDEPHVGVAAMQQRLQKSGYADLETDGRFGPETEKIVKRFQRKWGLRADGMYGQKTSKALDGVVAKTEQLAEAIEVRGSTSGITFVRAYGREMALRRQLEEGSSGLEAMIAKLVAAGIPEAEAKAVAAKNKGAAGKLPGGKAVEMRRMPNGMFAPKGQGEILKVGDTVKVPHANDKANVKGNLVAGKVTNVDKIGTAQVELDDGPDKGQPFQVAAAHNPAWASSGSETGTGASPVEGAAESVKAKVAAATAKHGSPDVQTGHISPSADATSGDETAPDLTGSPGRGPTGKLRNFKAMSGTKLKKTIADLTAFGKDDEALAAVKAVAKEKGVAWAEPDAPAPKAKASAAKSGDEKPDKPAVKSYDPKKGPSAEEKAANAAAMHGTPKPTAAAPAAAAKPVAKAKPKSEPSAAMKGGPKAGGGKGPSGAAKLPEVLSPNVGGYSLHELPLGATFSLADGTQYHTHKQVGDEGQWMISKPVGGGKAKPFHKMLAPAHVGPQVEGYAGAEGSASSPEAAAGAEDDLAAKLESSVQIAKTAKASGEKANFKKPAADAPAPVANAAALAAYEAAGGTDPAIIAALKAAASAAPAKMAA